MELAELSDENLESLRRSAELGQMFTFDSAIEDIKLIRELVAAFANQDPRYEPLGQTDKIVAVLGDLRNAMAERRTFEPVGDPQASHGQLVTRIQQLRGAITELVVPYLRVDPARAAAEAAYLSELLTGAEPQAAQIQNLLKTSQDRAAEKASSDLASYFQKQATGHENLARFFIGGIIVSVALTGGAAWALFILATPHAVPESGGEWLVFARDIAFRLVILGLTTYLIRFTVRQYGINKHLQVINQHRANTLDTYPLLVGAAPDDLAKEHMSLLLTQAAIAPFGTGYEGAAADAAADAQLLSLAETMIRSTKT